MSAATTYTVTGPTFGNVTYQSAGFLVTPNGTYTGTITITASDSGIPVTVLTFNNSSAGQYFTIQPTIVGNITLTFTNNESLTNPGTLTYNSKHFYHFNLPNTMYHLVTDNIDIVCDAPVNTQTTITFGDGVITDTIVVPSGQQDAVKAYTPSVPGLTRYTVSHVGEANMSDPTQGLVQQVFTNSKLYNPGPLVPVKQDSQTFLEGQILGRELGGHSETFYKV